ncbi:DUF5906 domain-containing protein [Rhodovibrio sodomensis]|nr:DUF5906 domain-containing protein [Rhodovibrio sodomensis]
MTDDNAAPAAPQAPNGDDFGTTLHTLSANGYSPLPIVPADKTFWSQGVEKQGGKTPGRLLGTTWQAMTGWQRYAREPASPATLRRWAEWPARGVGEPGCGLAAGYGGLVVPDLDTLSPTAAEAAQRLADKHLGAAPVRTGKAPKTSRLYRCDEPLKRLRSATFELDGVLNTVELQVDGQQTVAFGVHPDTGRPYEWSEGSPLDTPVSELTVVTREQIEAFIDAWENEMVLVHEAEMKTAGGGAVDREEKPESALTAGAEKIRAALPYVHNEDRHYDDWVSIAHALKSALRNAEGEALDIWHEFSAKSDKYDPDYTDRVWQSIDAETVNSIGAGTWFHEAQQGGWNGRPEPGDEFPPIAEADRPADDRSPIERAVDEVNAEYAIAQVGSRVVVVRGQKDEYGRPTTPAFLSVPDTRNFLANRRIKDPKAGKKAQERSVADIWLQSPRRKTYNGVTFDPSGTKPDTYNLWCGFAVEPDPSASCQRFLDHLRDNVARGDETIYRWVVGWFAHMIQRPGTKPGTALVLKGTQGTGKSIVGEVIGRLFPPHHTKVSSPEQFTGRFNRHFNQALLVQAEEAFWAGGKDAVGKLKDMITGSTMQLEAKCVDAYQIKSVMRLLITSNEEWVVPVEVAERRFAVLNVSNARAQDHAYFRAILQEMEQGGYGALLHHLQRFDLSTVNVGQVPKTEGLLDQKIQSLDSVAKFWFDCLREGDVPGAHDFNGGWPEKPEEVSKRVLFETYRARLKDKQYHTTYGVDGGQFGKQLRILAPSIKDTKRRCDSGQVRFYVLPPLDDCRAQFEAWIGHSIPWEDGEDA